MALSKFIQKNYSSYGEQPVIKHESIPPEDRIPTQTGQSGKYLTTDGTSISWATVDTLPSQTGQSGKYLTTDGSSPSWATVNALPPQSSETADKFLKSTGTAGNEEWTVIDGLPTQTGQGGKFLTTNGITASWATVQGGSVYLYTRQEDTITSESTNPPVYDLHYFTEVQVYVNGVLKIENETYSVSNYVVTFLSSVPVDTKITLVYYKDVNLGTLPVATSQSLGTVKIGSGLSITAEGLLSSIDEIPDKTSQDGKFLTTNGGILSWENVYHIPDQTSQSGKFLTTDGSVTSWGALPTTYDTLTANQFITSGGTSSQFVKGDGSLDSTTYLDASLKGANNGLAELDSNGKVPTAQLPAYVDDVLEFDSLADFPVPGESGKIYVARDTNKTYRWSGTQYVEISPSLALGETESTAYRGDRGAAAYAHGVTNKGSAFSEGFYKITTNAEGHVTAATSVVKSDITALGIPGDDSKVAQTNSTLDNDYRLLLSNSASDTSETESSYKSNKFTANPSTGVMSVGTLNADEVITFGNAVQMVYNTTTESIDISFI